MLLTGEATLASILLLLTGLGESGDSVWDISSFSAVFDKQTNLECVFDGKEGSMDGKMELLSIPGHSSALQI